MVLDASPHTKRQMEDKEKSLGWGALLCSSNCPSNEGACHLCCNSSSIEYLVARLVEGVSQAPLQQLLFQRGGALSCSSTLKSTNSDWNPAPHYIPAAAPAMAQLSTKGGALPPPNVAAKGGAAPHGRTPGYSSTANSSTVCQIVASEW